MTDTVTNARPVIVASQCLGFAAVRYNGAIINDDFVQRLAREADIIEVCPEVAIGLGVPRPPIRMQKRDDAGVVLIQPATGRDITHDMTSYAKSFVASLPPVDGFILKSRSPSCGIADVGVFNNDGATVLDTRAGMFAATVLEAFPQLPVEDELTLRDRGHRRHFLTRIYALARFRAAASTGTASALVAFQTAYKYVLMSYSPERTTALGRMVADCPRPAPHETFAAYAAVLHETLRVAPTQSGYVNALSHMSGYVSADHASSADRAELLALIQRYRTSAPAEGDALLDDVASSLGGMVQSQGITYLAGQAWFNPFPAGLL